MKGKKETQRIPQLCRTRPPIFLTKWGASPPEAAYGVEKGFKVPTEVEFPHFHGIDKSEYIMGKPASDSPAPRG